MAQEQINPVGYEGYQGYGAPMDPATMRQKLAMAMLQQGMDSSPIRSPWQGAARMSNALFGALMMRQAQQGQQNSWNKALANAPFGPMGGSAGLPPGSPTAGGAGAPGLPAQPGALADLANDPDIMRGVQNAAGNGLPDTATIGQSLAAGGGPPPRVGPPMPAMAPNNAAGGYPAGGPMPGGAASPMTPAGSMMGQNAPPRLDPRMMVAGPGAPSGINAGNFRQQLDSGAMDAPGFTPGAPPPPTGPAPGNSPPGAGAGGPGAFNPADLAMFQQDMQAVPGTPIGGGGGQGGGAPSPQAVMGYAAQKAAQLGIDPQVAQRFVMGENSGRVDVAGDGNSSFGPLQLHYGGINPNMPHPGLGDEFTKATGLNARDPSTWQQQIDFGLTKAAQGGWGPWQTTMNKLGYNNWSGIGPPPAGGAAPSAAPPTALAFGGGQTTPPAPAGPAVGAIANAAGPGGGLNGPPGGGQVPGSMQPNMMVAGPGAPSMGRGGGNPNLPPPPMLPDQGGGGNPLSALGNMFGLANPSSPEGGNGPTPPGGGAPAGANDPRMKQLMEVISDPYAAPGAKQVAMQFLQYYMPHPTTWETLPGTNDQVEKNWMGQFTGRRISGPDKFEAMDYGTDFMGQANKGFIENGQPYVVKNGQRIPLGQGGQGGQGGSSLGTSVIPGAGAPPPPIGPSGAASAPPGGTQVAGPMQGQAPTSWAPGQPLDQGTDSKLQGLAAQYAGSDPRAQAMVYQYAKALLQGNQQFVTTGAIAKAPYIEAAETIARQVDPDGMPQTRFDTIKQNADTSNPTALGGQRMAAQTSVRHIGSLAQASDLLASQGQISSSEMGAKVQDWAQRNLGGASSKFTDASQAYNAALVPVLGEIDKLYKGGQATEGEIMEMKSNLAPTASPDARRAALTMLGGLLQDKVQVLQDTWHMGAGKNFPDLPIIDKQGQAGLDYMKSWKGGAPPPGMEIVHPNGSPSGPTAYRPIGGAQAAPAPGGGVTHVWTPNGGLKPVGAQ